MKRLSLAEFAAMLGVSKTLVSLVLNGKGDQHGIRKETQRMVLKKAEELGYRPNPVARSLRTGKSNLIGLIVPDISNVFYALFARQLESEAGKAGYRLMICCSEEDPELEKQLIQILLDENNVSGLVLASTQRDGAHLKKILPENFPIVLMDRNLKGIDLDYVGVDNFKGAYDATKHLQDAGYQRIVALAITPDHLSSINERIDGYKKAMQRMSPKVAARVIMIPFEDVRTSVRKEMAHLVAPPYSVQAIFTLNNTITTYAVEYLNEIGLRIPQDVAVLSFDDRDYFRFLSPPVTAVVQPTEETGKRSFELLKERMQKPARKAKKIVLPVELAVRKSCGSFLKNA